MRVPEGKLFYNYSIVNILIYFASYNRAKSLSEEPVNITPKNGGTLPWANKDLNAFAREYNFKPVKISGHLDYNREIHV